MLMLIKTFIVWFFERFFGILDRTPIWQNRSQCYFARKSYALETKWQTNVWKDTTDDRS